MDNFSVTNHAIARFKDRCDQNANVCTIEKILQENNKKYFFRHGSPDAYKVGDYVFIIAKDTNDKDVVLTTLGKYEEVSDYYKKSKPFSKKSQRGKIKQFYDRKKENREKTLGILNNNMIQCL